MKRGAFLAATGLDLTTYKNLRHRGQIPFYEKIEGHTDFTVADAVRMRIMQDAMKDGGLSASAACWFMLAVWNTLGHKWRSDLEGLRDADIWAGVAAMREDRNGKRDPKGLVAWGGVEECASELAQGARAGRIIMVNVSRAADVVLRRVGALEAGDE